jgi:tryptophan synthase alpha chain
MVMQNNPKLRFMSHVYFGDPNPEFSFKLIKTLSQKMDILELGMPFSDPIADGPIFQEACRRALKNNISPNDVFDAVKTLKEENFNKQIVLTTYYNIIVQFGISEFAKKSASLGIYGLIVPDLSYEESAQLSQQCKENKIHLINLIAPTTTEERMKKIVTAASGFIYLVSVAGVTGTDKQKSNLQEIVNKIKSIKDIPVFVGFGIKTKQDIQELDFADGYIIGSEICKRYSIEGSDEEKLSNVEQFLDSINQIP